MLNLKPLQTPTPRIVFKAPREWLPRLRALLDAHPMNDLASTEALLCRMVGDFTAGIVLHRLLYWLPRGIRNDDAIWKSDREWYAELNLSYAQMKRVRAKIAPVVKSWVELAQGAPTYHYQLQVDALIRGIATVLNCSTVQVKLTILEKVENGTPTESKIDFRQSRESITIQHQNQDERLKIYHPYLNRFVGFTPDLSAKLADHVTRLGESTVREVLKRCDASKGQAWHYVLKALENVGTPASAPITALYDSPPAQPDQSAVIGERWEDSAEGRTWAARIEAAKNPKPAPMDKYADNWDQACKQLQMQDRASFDALLRDAHFLKFEAGVYQIGVPSIYIRDILQHRAYRDVQRMVSDLTGEAAELCFEVSKPTLLEDQVPLFRLLMQAHEAEQAFYRKYEGKK